MTATALIKKSDLNRMADIATARGVRVEVEVDGKIIRVSPDKILDADWLRRAQSAIRHKKQMVRTIQNRMYEFPRPGEMAVSERREAILEVIRDDIGENEMKAYVEIAKQRRPDLFAKQEGPVDNGEKSE